VRGCEQDPLEVLEEEQEMLVMQKGFQEVHERSSTGLFDAKGLSDGGNVRVLPLMRGGLDVITHAFLGRIELNRGSLTGYSM
jgi:hypothetical protein